MDTSYLCLEVCDALLKCLPTEKELLLVEPYQKVSVTASVCHCPLSVSLAVLVYHCLCPHRELPHQAVNLSSYTLAPY